MGYMLIASDNNLPPGITQEHEMFNEPKLKECPSCLDDESLMPCELCDNSGKITIDAEELRNQIEARMEKQSGIYNQ